MTWLVNKLVDNGWVRLGLAFRWVLGTKRILVGLVNESDLGAIERRHKLMEQSGFFSGKSGAANQQAFIQALFAFHAWKLDAFNKALDLAYSWNKNPSVAPLEAFLGFIHRIFFRGPSADNNKQAFIDAVLTQNNGESNALAHAAWVRASETGLSPLTMVLGRLTEAGCFTSPENKQKVIQGICKLNRNGKNALSYALKSKTFDRSTVQEACPNISTLLNVLEKADCFNGPSAESSKKTFIQGALSGEVLGEAVWDDNALQQIFLALRKAGCFSNPQGVQAFIDALIKPNGLVESPLSYAHSSGSLELIYDQLEQIGCFTKAENRQKIINAIFYRAGNGGSALLRASSDENRLTRTLGILTQVQCFEGPTGSANQQAFIRAALAADECGYTCIYQSLGDAQIFNQLRKLKYFEGKFAEQNKQAFIKAVLSPTKIGEEQMGSALSRHCNFPTFPLLLEELTAAGCFSDTPGNANKEVFINAVFAKDKHGQSMLSAIYKVNDIIQLLKKLEEAGCFKNAEYRKQFIQAVRANGNEILFKVIEVTGCEGYTALHSSLLLAGCSKQDIKKLLNERVQQQYRTHVFTPLELAQDFRNEGLVKRLIEDGAEEPAKPERSSTPTQSDYSFFAGFKLHDDAEPGLDDDSEPEEDLIAASNKVAPVRRC